MVNYLNVHAGGEALKHGARFVGDFEDDQRRVAGRDQGGEQRGEELGGEVAQGLDLSGEGYVEWGEWVGGVGWIGWVGCVRRGR